MGIPIERNTPTCVGKTFQIKLMYLFTWKHPHLRGEDLTQCQCNLLVVETPPPAWGRPTLCSCYVLRCGNTPTCVGKTGKRHGKYVVSKKHPHLRGEDSTEVMTGATFSETPPPAWGRHPSSKRYVPKLRNTPTCVGKTAQSLQSFAQPRKHPHLRGEDSPPSDACLLPDETPPPAWGRPPRNEQLPLLSGNTPTCVGKTSLALNLPLLCRKHPHLRGEDVVFLRPTESAVETPPPAWGRRCSNRTH